MRNDLVEMVFILDRSGSMAGLADETIGGFNGLIENQKKEQGEAFVTTVLFDNEYIVLHDHVNLKDIKPITNKEYYPRGMTALLDAIGNTINSVGKRLSDTPEEERPCQVIFVITTDGYENASREFTKAQIKNMIEHQQEKYNWTFMFLGANIDTISEGGSMGISAGMSKNYSYSKAGVDSVYKSVSKSVSIGRTYGNSIGISQGVSSGMSYSSGHSTSMTSADYAEIKKKMEEALDEIVDE